MKLDTVNSLTAYSGTDWRVCTWGHYLHCGSRISVRTRTVLHHCRATGLIRSPVLSDDLWDCLTALLQTGGHPIGWTAMWRQCCPGGGAVGGCEVGYTEVFSDILSFLGRKHSNTTYICMYVLLKQCHWHTASDSLTSTSPQVATGGVTGNSTEAFLK